MVPLVQFRIVTTSATTADLILAAVQDLLALTSGVIAERGPAAIPWHGRWLVHGIVRCATATAADSIENAITTRWAGPWTTMADEDSHLRRVIRGDDGVDTIQYVRSKADATNV